MTGIVKLMFLEIFPVISTFEGSRDDLPGTITTSLNVMKSLMFIFIALVILLPQLISLRKAIKTFNINLSKLIISLIGFIIY
jgi:hypothetical protein